MWKQLSDEAMAKLMNGDRAGAIALWQKSVASIDQEKPAADVELGQVYYYLGKCVADDGDVAQGIKLLTRAEEIVEGVDQTHPSIRQIKYDLGYMLQNSGQNDGGRVSTTMKQFKGVVEKRLPELLQGEPKDDLSLRQTIKAIQKIGLAKDLNAKEFTRLHEVLTDEGRADSDDESSVHPFDLLFAYYYDNDQRCHNDLCVAFDEFFNIEKKLEELLSRLDAAVGKRLFPADNVAVIRKESSGDADRFYLIVDEDVDGVIAAPLGSHVDFASIIQIYNQKLKHVNDPRRFIRLCSYDDREAALLLPEQVAAKLYMSGAGCIFEDIAADIEPKQPSLERLS